MGRFYGLPSKPETTLEGYRYSKHSWHVPKGADKDPWFIHRDKRHKNREWWPCLKCGGQGSIRIPNDWVTAHMCPKCKGFGKTTKQVIEDEWNKKQEEYNKALAIYNEELKKAEAIMDRLTEEEHSLIMDYFESDGCCSSSTGYENEMKRVKKK